MAKRKTHEEFVAEMAVENPNVMLLEKYTNSRVKLSCKCMTHQQKFEMTSRELLKGRGCEMCQRENRSKGQQKTHGEFVSDLKKINPSVEILGEYVGSANKIACRCRIDGSLWEATPNNLLRGSGCPECGLKRRTEKRAKTHEEFVEDIKAINANIKILGNYINSKTKLLCECQLDGHKWESTPSDLLNGYGCPRCNASKGEKTIESVLSTKEIKYKCQHTFIDCRHKYKLRFDFYLPETQTAIEFDGIQHFKPIDFFGGQPAFEQQQKRDGIKDRYCKENNIKLIRIPYTEKNIEAYLEEKLGRVAS